MLVDFPEGAGFVSTVRLRPARINYNRGDHLLATAPPESEVEISIIYQADGSPRRSSNVETEGCEQHIYSPDRVLLNMIKL